MSVRLQYSTFCLDVALAEAELRDRRYQWCAGSGGTVRFRYVPPYGPPCSWAAVPGDRQLACLGLETNKPPFDWKPLPVKADALAVADAACWNGELEHVARELADRGFRAAWTWNGRWSVVGAGRVVGCCVRPSSFAELLAEADLVTYGTLPVKPRVECLNHRSDS